MASVTVSQRAEQLAAHLQTHQGDNKVALRDWLTPVNACKLAGLTGSGRVVQAATYNKAASTGLSRSAWRETHQQLSHAWERRVDIAGTSFPRGS